MVTQFDVMIQDQPGQYDVRKYAEMTVALADVCKVRNSDVSVATKVLAPVSKHILCHESINNKMVDVLECFFKNSGKSAFQGMDMAGLAGQLANALTNQCASNLFSLANSLFGKDDELQTFYERAAHAASRDNVMLDKLLSASTQVRGRVKPLKIMDDLSYDGNLVVPAVLSHGVFITEDKAKSILLTLSQKLDSDPGLVLAQLHEIFIEDTEFLSAFIHNTPEGRRLISELWSLSLTETGERASQLLAQLQAQSPSTEVETILKDLSTCDNLDQVVIFVERARSLIDRTENDRSSMLRDLILGIQWNSIVATVLDTGVPNTAVVSNPLGGSVLLVNKDNDAITVNRNAICIATFTVSLLSPEYLPQLGVECFSILNSLLLISEASTMCTQFTEVSFVPLFITRRLTKC
jgi:hypothetical protein